MVASYKICILTSTGEISHTISFSDMSSISEDQDQRTYNTNFKIHPDDSIRTIKMKLLYELYQGEHANRIQLRPIYEEIYMYGFAT